MKITDEMVEATARLLFVRDGIRRPMPRGEPGSRRWEQQTFTRQDEYRHRAFVALAGVETNQPSKENQ